MQRFTTASGYQVHIVSPKGGLLVRGCITGTLWEHVREQLGPAKEEPRQ